MVYYADFLLHFVIILIIHRTISSVGRYKDSFSGEKQTVSPLDQWDMVKVLKMQELHRAHPPPPVAGMGLLGLAVCRHNLWPAVRIEPGQKTG
jgi:hypothetical protein